MLDRIKPSVWLLIGVITVTAAHMSVSVDLFGWFAYTPFLIYLKNTSGTKSRFLFFGALVVAWSCCILKIVSPPMPVAMVFLYSFPISLIHLPGFLLWDKFKQRKWSLFLFPAVVTVMEWIQYTFTPFASWGVAAYTQVNSIAIKQCVSVFGMAGLSFLIYWVNVSIAEILTQRKINTEIFYAPLLIFIALFSYGALRVGVNKAQGKEMIKVAAVGSDSEISGFPLPSKESNDSVIVSLFNRTELAASANARLIVWNEGSTFIFPTEESTWKNSLSALSKRLGIFLVAAYIVPISETPMKYENKYLFFDPQGMLLKEYNKHQPVPGEPAVKGTESLSVFEIDHSKTGAVICYDYDFPYLAKGYGKLNADIVADPSSDWRGIDPLHSLMAGYRAIEQGHSIIRSTRFGMSAAITPHGEMISQMSSFDSNDRIMIAVLPANKVITIYSILGDTFAYTCIGFILAFIITTVRNKK